MRAVPLLWFDFTSYPLQGKIKKSMDPQPGSDGALQQALRQARRALIQVVHSVSVVAAQRDHHTAVHQQRTAHLALAIGQELTLNQHQLEGLYLGALVHDVGKIAIPSEILNKPARLTSEEYALVKTHVQVGCRLLESVELPWPVRTIIAQHHERLDGSGYPHGLTAPAIPVEARIVAVADVFQAMTEHRPYRPPLPSEVALEELMRGANALFDGEVLRALESVLGASRATGKTLWTHIESNDTFTSTVVLPAPA